MLSHKKRLSAANTELNPGTNVSVQEVAGAHSSMKSISNKTWPVPDEDADFSQL